MDAKDKRIAALEAKIAALEKNSATSSKPPSSDLVKPPKQKDKRKKKRKIGAQKGHKQHLRQSFDENQVELVDKPFVVTEFQQLRYWCSHCQCFHTAQLPPDIAATGLFGPKLIALTTYLKGRGHMSYKTIQQLFADALSLKTSTGFLVKQVRKASEAMEIPYQELVDQLPHEPHLHVDETGGKENGKKR